MEYPENIIHNQINLTEIELIEIKKSAIEFTNNILGNENPDKKCYAISYPLSIHLFNNGISNSIRVGSVKGVGHYWIKLEYENGFIIDPTARQFNPTFDYVHFGEKLAKENDYNFVNVYKQWSEPLINNKFDETIPQKEMENVPPQNRIKLPAIEPYIKIGIKATTILIRDNKLDENNMKYIDCICLASKNFYGAEMEKLAKADDTDEFINFYRCNKNRWIKYI